MLRLAVFVVLVTVALGQERCCSPPTWEGHLIRMEGTRYRGNPGARLADSSLHIDYATQRWSMHTRGDDTWHGRYNYKQIFDYRNKREWIIDFDGQHCFRRPLTGMMTRDCIGRPFEFGGNFYMGAGTDRLDASYWSMRTEHEYVGETRTRDGCVIATIHELNYTDTNNARMNTWALVDVTPTIKDPYAFTPPSFCQQPSKFDSKLLWKLQVLDEMKLAKRLFTEE